MPGGEKMLKAIASADSKQDGLDHNELADALKQLKPKEIENGLKNKSEEIAKVKGIDVAVTDLIAKHTEGAITLDPKQEKALYALHQSLLVREGGRVNLKKEGVSILSDKESVQNQLWQSNIDNTLKDTDYTFVDWLADGGQDNKGIAVITNQKNERYHVAFASDGSLKTTSIKETYTRDGILQKDTPEKIAYIGIDKKFVIEDKELFDKKLKTKEFANKLDDLSVDGIFLKQQQLDGAMNVAYFSETGLSTIVKPIFEKGEGIDPTAKKMFDTYNTAITSAEKAKVDAISAFDAGKAKIDAMTSTTTEVWRKGEVTKLETIRDGELKKQQSIIDANNENLVDLYKTYASSNVASLIDKSTDKFTINTDLTLTNALGESVSLNVDGKKDPESVSGHVALDNNNLLLKIDKTATNTGWTAYKKKVGEDTGYTTQSTKGVDVTNPIVEKPKEVVSENVDLNKRIDALNDGFMLNGGNFEKKTAIESTRGALKSLAVDGQSTVVGMMVSDMESASKASDNKQREVFNAKAQESINKIITDNKLSISLDLPSSYFVNGKLKTDGRWGKVTTDVLVKVSQELSLLKKADTGTPVELDAYGNTVHYITSLDIIDPTKFKTPDWGTNVYVYNGYYIYGNGRVKDSKTDEMFDRNQVKDAMASKSAIVETNKGVTTAGTVEKNNTAPVSTPNTPSPAPKTAETKKPTIDALATERKQLIDLQETAKKELNPLLKKLVPDANGMNDYIKHLPKGYTQQLTILDQTLKMDPKTISDKIAFEKVYPSMSINVKNLTLSLNTLNKKTAKDYSDFFLLPHNKSQVNTVLASVTKFQNAKLDNSRSNDLQKGYIKFADPTNKYLSSRFPANFLSSPTYKNGERMVGINKDILVSSINDRVRQTTQLNIPKDVSKDVFV